MRICSRPFQIAEKPSGVPPQSMRTIIFCKSLLPLQRPVSFYCMIPGFYRLSIDSVGKKRSEKNKLKRGQRQSIRTPSQSEGSIPVGSSRGILKGGTIRAGASCSPLEPASLHTFLPEQESMAAGRQDKPI